MKVMSVFINTLLLSFCLFTSGVISASEKAIDKHEGIEIVVNINKADIEELDTLLIGVGESKAQAIIDYRNENGKFTTINELANVKGIGEKLIEKNKNRIKL
ncbi:ComEA family DNA-binding protein [Aliivibrio salmonicida]|jgi:competence protein ComEA|nr:ComEA family DNA-binding protein [Aliivibrio salmonicida]AZL84226.1 ComEA family DNA-binding protein [Aliivibrio salmonicida]